MFVFSNLFKVMEIYEIYTKKARFFSALSYLGIVKRLRNGFIVKLNTYLNTYLVTYDMNSPFYDI